MLARRGVGRGKSKDGDRATVAGCESRSSALARMSSYARSCLSAWSRRRAVRRMHAGAGLQHAGVVLDLGAPAKKPAQVSGLGRNVGAMRKFASARTFEAGKTDVRRHRTLPWQIGDRREAVSLGLKELLNMRAAEREAKKHAQSRSRRVRPPWSWSQAEIDGKHRRADGPDLDSATLDAVLRKAMLDALARNWTRDDWRAGHYALTESGFARLGYALWMAELMRVAARGGLGQRPVGTIDGTWMITARLWLADHELGWIFRAADAPDANPDDALARWEPCTADAADLRAREARKRWDRLRAAGFIDMRPKTAI